MPPSPLAPHGRARIFSILVGGFGRRGPISSPPLPSVALCALKDAALDLMRAPGRRAWLWALYPAPPCPPPQPRLRVRGGAPFFGGSKNHPLPLQSRKGVDFSPQKWEKRPFGGGGRERKIGGFAKKRGGGGDALARLRPRGVVIMRDIGALRKVLSWVLIPPSKTPGVEIGGWVGNW